MFSPYSPAFASDAGTLWFFVTAALEEAGVTALFVLAPGEADEHAFIQIIKKAITATTPRMTVFHQSRGCVLLNIVFMVFLLFLQLPVNLPSGSLRAGSAQSSNASAALHTASFRAPPRAAMASSEERRF